MRNEGFEGPEQLSGGGEAGGETRGVQKGQAMGMPGGQGNTDLSGNQAGGDPPEIVVARVSKSA